MTVLDLSMCGRMTDSVLELLGDQCPNLISVHLHGPFLVSAESFVVFFKAVAKSLISLSLEQAAKLDDDSIAGLVTYCNKLESLEIDSRLFLI